MQFSFWSLIEHRQRHPYGENCWLIWGREDIVCAYKSLQDKKELYTAIVSCVYSNVHCHYVQLDKFSTFFPWSPLIPMKSWWLFSSDVEDAGVWKMES